MIRFVTDTTCDLPDGQLAALDVAVVPINIIFGGEEFLEGETLSYLDFFDKVDTLGIVPQTSQPSPGKFVEVFRRLAAEGATTVLSLHVTGKLSGTVQSAQMAADIVRNEVDVRVFDSLAGSAGTGFMILEAVDLVAQGVDANAILARWAEMRESLRIFFYLDTLKYARMSGRVGALQSSLASMLRIKPLVRLDDGLLSVAERVRTRRAALDRLLDMMAEEMDDRPLNLAVVHAADQPSAEALMAEARKRFRCRQTFIARLAASLVTHLGVGTLGVVAYPLAEGSQL